MNILFLWGDVGVGGGELAMINLSNELSRQHKLDLLVINNHITRVVTQFHNIFIIAEPTQNKLIKIYVLLKTVIKLIKIARNYDVIIINDDIFNSKVLFLANHFLPKIKIVLWSHLSKDYFVSHNNKLNIYLNRYLLCNIATHIICVSKFAKQDMEKFIEYKKHVDYIYNIYTVIHDDKIPLLRCKQQEITNGILIQILFVGRLSSEKGADVLINALAKVRQYGFENFKLTICGDGEERDRLQQLTTHLGLLNYINFVGYQKDVASYYKTHHIYVSSSYTETLSFSVLEAINYECFVIASNTAAGEIITNINNNILVPIGDSDSLASTLLLVMTDDSIRNTMLYDKEHILSPFKKDIVYKQWIDLLT